jgi:hypothetical protein
MDGFAVYFHTTSTIFTLFTHTHKASVSDEHTTERRLGRDDATEDDDDDADVDDGRRCRRDDGTRAR